MIAIWQKIRVFVAQHKIASTLAIVVVAGGGYYIYGRLTSTATASKGTVIVAVSGTGQVSASNQVDIKPKVSADVVSVPVSVGQSVKAGAVIAYLDATNARKAVRDAQVNLDSAKLSLQKLQQPADTLSITQAQNSLASAQDSLANAQGDLVKDYDSAFTATAEAFVDLPTIMTSLQDMLYTTNPTLGGGGQWATNYYALASVQYNPNVQQYKDDLYSKYQKVRVSYDKNFSDYKAASRTSATSTIQDLTDQTYKTAQGIAEVVKGASTLIQAYQDALTGAGIKYISLSDTQLNTLNGYTSRLY
jgi:HlyD family secretion protein